MFGAPWCKKCVFLNLHSEIITFPGGIKFEIWQCHVVRLPIYGQINCVYWRERLLLWKVTWLYHAFYFVGSSYTVLLILLVHSPDNRAEGALRSFVAWIHLLKHCADKGHVFEMSGCLWNFGSLFEVSVVRPTCAVVRYTPCHEISGWGNTRNRVLVGASDASWLEIS